MEEHRNILMERVSERERKREKGKVSCYIPFARCPVHSIFILLQFSYAIISHCNRIRIEKKDIKMCREQGLNIDAACFLYFLCA